jgi:hypothetical protein
MCGGGVYSVTPPSSGTAWKTSTIYTFGTVAPAAFSPTSAANLAANGELYFSTAQGGAYNHGAVVALKKPASGNGPWSATRAYSMTGGSGGAYPTGAVFLDTKGNLYGTTLNGGNTDTSNTGLHDQGCSVLLT